MSPPYGLKHVRVQSFHEMGTDVPRMVVMSVEGSGTMRDIILHDLTVDMEGELGRFYGEALAPVLIRAISELAAETALKFFDMDEHIEAFTALGQENPDGAG